MWVHRVVRQHPHVLWHGEYVGEIVVIVFDTDGVEAELRLHCSVQQDVGSGHPLDCIFALLQDGQVTQIEESIPVQLG